MRCLLIALAAVVTTSTARADTWQADPEGSRVVVHAFRRAPSLSRTITTSR
jgi:hypothetical protein